MKWSFTRKHSFRRYPMVLEDVTYTLRPSDGEPSPPKIWGERPRPPPIDLGEDEGPSEAPESRRLAGWRRESERVAYRSGPYPKNFGVRAGPKGIFIHKMTVPKIKGLIRSLYVEEEYKANAEKIAEGMSIEDLEDRLIRFVLE